VDTARVCHVLDRQEPGLCGCAPVTQICAPRWRSAGCLRVRDDAAMLLPPWWAAALSGRKREVVALIARGDARRRDRAAGRAQSADRGDARQPRDDHGGRADRAQLVVLACQYGLAALPARDEEITSSTRARQSSR